MSKEFFEGTKGTSTRAPIQMFKNKTAGSEYTTTQEMVDYANTFY